MPLYNDFDGETLKTYLELEFSVVYDEKTGEHSVFLGEVDVTKSIDSEIMQSLQREWNDAEEDRNDDDQFVDPYFERGISRSDFV